MKIRKLIYFLLAIVMIFTLSSCGKDKSQQEIETTTENNITSVQNEQITEMLTTEVSTTVSATAAPETTTQKQWTNAEIAEIYKKAALGTHSTAKSVQKITLDDISIGGGGAVNSIIKMIKPVINKVVESNSTEFVGITGGYSMLTEADIASAALTNADGNTIIKMSMKDQTDKGAADANSGTVGHAISVIADLSGVFGQLKDSGLPVEISEDNMTMTYRNAQVNVLIDSNGRITRGTWVYVVTLNLENFKVAGSTVEDTTVIIRNTITVNGGF